MILAVDPGLSKCGWAVVEPRTAAIAELGLIVSERDSTLDTSTDRARRIDRQAEILLELVRRHGCDRIAAEGVTLGGPVHVKLAMATGLYLSWGVLTGIARCLGIGLYEVMPKVWQHAVQPGRKKIHYDSLESAMQEHVGPQVGAQLLAIASSNRNHALDACGIGMLAALRPHEATRIIARRVVA